MSWINGQKTNIHQYWRTPAFKFWVMSFLVIAPSASNEAQFFFSGNNEDYLFISLFVGLTVGGTLWPMMSDVLGRKWMFTSTIVLMGMGGLVGAGMPSFTGLSVVDLLSALQWPVTKVLMV